MSSPVLVSMLAAATIALSGAAAALQPQPPGTRPGPRAPGGPTQPERKILAQFDKDGDGRLSTPERAAAREFLRSDGARPRGPGGPGGPGRRMRPPGAAEEQKPSPGPHVAKDDAAPSDAPLYDPSVLRTVFLDFESEDWEQELGDFMRTDVEVPATLTVDGEVYPGVGVQFRGASSLFMVGPGSKRSLNISVDFTDNDQRVLGAKTLNLLNSHGDPSFMRTVLYAQIARSLGVPSPKANFVRLVINGESWGLYTNAQQFNKDMLEELYGSGKGERWKVPGSPNGRGGLEYLGEDIAPYRERYEIKSGDDDDAWRALIRLCRTLNETPIEELEEALRPMLDLDDALWFLAMENALVNSDGYWVRASDYSIFLDERGVFHLVPHDANETFHAGGGPGGMRRRGPGPAPDPGAPPPPREPGDRPAREPGQGPDDRPGGPGRFGPGMVGGPALDPLVGLDDPTKPLRSRLLQVPSLRTKYLANMRTIAEKWLDWQTLGAMVAQHRGLIQAEVEADTKKLTSFDAFLIATADGPAPQAEPAAQPRGISLRRFADERRKFLLAHPALTGAPPENAPAPADP